VLPLLGVYPKSGYNSHLYMIFIATLFTIASFGNKVPYNYEWIKKMWYIYTVEYYSTIRNNDM
jgi:hypothetical protein